MTRRRGGGVLHGLGWLAWLLLPAPVREEACGELDDLFRLRRARGSRVGRVWYAGQLVRFAVRLRMARLTGGPLPGESASRADLRWRGLGQEARWAVRGLLRQRRFTIVAVSTLALGVAATTSIFTLVHGVLLAPLPFGEPDALRAVGVTGREWDGRSVYAVSPRLYDELRASVNAWSGIAAVGTASLVLREAGDALLLDGAAVSHEFFSVLRVPVQLGASFDATQDYAGAEPAIVLSDALWRTRFGADPGIVGRRLRFEGGVRTVTGVAASGFAYRGNPRYAGLDAADFWVPFEWDRASGTYRFSNYLQLIGRLAADANDARAQAELDRVFAGLGAEYESRGGLGAVSLRDWIVAPTRKPLGLLLGAVVLVLLIACANVANLMLARSESRRRELAVRAALGAGARRITVLLLFEGLLVALAAGALGVAAAWSGTRVLAGLFAPLLPRAADVTVRLPVLAFGIGLALLAGLVTGGVAALRARLAGLRSPLQSGVRTVGGGRRARHTLVIAETALAFVLVAGAGLLLRSFWALQRVDPGFETENRLAVRLVLPEARYATSEATSQFYHALADAVAALPGVLAAGATDHVPMEGGSYSRGVFEPGEAKDTVVAVEMRYVTPGYGEAIGLRIEQGRGFTRTDRAGAEPVALISASLARALFTGRPAVGRRIGLTGFDQPGDAGLEIVGVVADVHEFGPHRAAPHTVYIPHAQEPRNRTAMTLIVWTRGDPAERIADVREIIRTRDSALPIVYAAPVRTLLADSIRERRLLLILLGAFGFAAVGLGAAGVYAVMAYTVALRRREVGVRMALGARPNGVLRSICAQALWLATAGIAIGAAGALLLRRTIEGFLFGVAPWDPPTFALGALALALVALAGSWVPARRAARVDPIEVLRQE